MNSLTNVETSLTMSSREIAELTGKRHDHVMRDIRAMLIELHGEAGLPNFGASYLNEQNKAQPCFNLPKRETLILVSGYSVALRAKIIDRWQELEGQLQQPQHQIPQTRAEALRLAADLEEQNAKLVTQIEQNRPKVDFFDKVVDAENTLPVGDVAKILGTGEHRLFKLLRDERLMNKENIPYQRYLDTGLFLVKTTIHQFEDRGRQIVNRTPVVTGKGLAYLQNKYFPVGSRQLSLLHKNPNPPGSIKPGSTTDRVLKLLTDHPRKTYSESEIMREIRSTHGSVSFALVQLRHFGAITAIPSEQNDRYFLYRIKNEALAA